MRTELLCISTVLLLSGLACSTPEPAPEEPIAPRSPGAQADPGDAESGKDPSLAGWWQFDEDSGQTARDSSGHGRDGTLTGGLSFGESSMPGRIGRALELDGDGERYVRITGYRGVTGTRPRTVAAWIRTERPRGQVLSWGTEEGGRMWIYGFIRSGLGVTPHGGYLYGNSRVHDGAWHHVAVVVEEVELPNLHDHVRLYRNGLPEEIDDIGLLDLWPLDTGSDLEVRIGAGFRGLLDDIRIYERALSAEEIRDLFTSAGTDSRPPRP